MNLKKVTAAGIAALMMSTSVVIVPAALAQNGRQKDKNLMRNLGIGLGAGAAYKTLKGDWKTGLVLGAGAAIAGKKYEDQRKSQNRQNRTTREYRYRNGQRVGYYNTVNGKRIGGYRRL